MKEHRRQEKRASSSSSISRLPRMMTGLTRWPERSSFFLKGKRELKYWCRGGGELILPQKSSFKSINGSEPAFVDKIKMMRYVEGGYDGKSERFINTFGE